MITLVVAAESPRSDAVDQTLKPCSARPHAGERHRRFAHDVIANNFSGRRELRPVPFTATLPAPIQSVVDLLGLYW